MKLYFLMDKGLNLDNFFMNTVVIAVPGQNGVWKDGAECLSVVNQTSDYQTHFSK